jgi:hypothetical protein
MMNVHERESINFFIEWIKIKRSCSENEHENENEGFWQSHKLIPYKVIDPSIPALYRDVINKVDFGGRVRLSPHYNYDIIIKISPGTYYHGVPYCRNTHEIFTIQRVKNVDKGFAEKGNTSIGGPLYGFMFTRCKGRII